MPDQSIADTTLDDHIHFLCTVCDLKKKMRLLSAVDVIARLQ